MPGKRSPIYDWHAQNGARFFEFAGWEVPEAYGKVEAEYAALRNGAGLVDLCHEGRFRFEGDDAAKFLNEVVTIDLGRLDVGNSTWGYVCNARGGIVDEVTVYRDESYFLMQGNGVARLALAEWLEECRSKRQYRVNMTDVSSAQLMIGLRGAGALALLERVTFGQRFALDPGQAMVATIGTARCLIVKRLLAPEGFDIIVGSVFLQPIWEKLMDAARATGARPIGFSALEMVRIEAGYPRVGFEIDQDTTPLEINMGHRVDFTKQAFHGRRALMHATSNEFARVMVMMRFEADRRIEPGAEVLFDTMPIGRITSKCFSPMIRATLCMGFVNAIKAIPGTRVVVRSREGELYVGEVVRPSQVQITQGIGARA